MYKLEVNGDIRVYPGFDLYVGSVGLDDNGDAASGASLVGLWDDSYYNISADTDVQGAIGEIDSIGEIDDALINLAGETIPPGSLDGQTLRFNGSDWIIDQNLFNDGTNVGIGTTSPDYKLEVNGDIRAYPGF